MRWWMKRAIEPPPRPTMRTSRGGEDRGHGKLDCALRLERLRGLGGRRADRLEGLGGLRVQQRLGPHRSAEKRVEQEPRVAEPPDLRNSLHAHFLEAGDLQDRLAFPCVAEPEE